MWNILYKGLKVVHHGLWHFSAPVLLNDHGKNGIKLAVVITKV